MLQKRRNAVMAIGLAFVLTLAVSGAAAQDVKTNSMPGVDFSKFHTYKWVPIEGGAHPDQIMDQEIKQSVDSQLTTKGLTKTDSDKADLYIGYQIAVDKEKQWNAYGMGGRWGGGGMASATQSTINVGTFVLDMYEPAEKPGATQQGHGEAVEELPAETEVNRNAEWAREDLYENRNLSRQDSSYTLLAFGGRSICMATRRPKSRDATEGRPDQRGRGREQAGSCAIYLG
jgi:hypothetical protein